MAWDFGAEIHALTGYNADNSDAYSATNGDGAISEETLKAHADQWLTDAAKTVIHLLPRELKIKCSTRSTLNNAATTLDLDGKGEIIYVVRVTADSSGYQKQCREITPVHADLSNDSDSLMYYATASDPVYWITANSSGNPTLFVKPLPTSAQVAYVHHITYPTVVVTNSSIDNFPDEAEQLVVLEASMKALCYKMAEMHTLVPMHSDQDIANGGAYGSPDSNAQNQGWEQVRHWIENEEDSELAGVNAQVLGAEVQQWVAEYQWYQSKHQMLKAEFGEKIMALRGQQAQPQQPVPPREQQRGR